MASGPKTTVYLRNVPRNVKDQFKAACYKRGSDMTATIVELMKTYIAKKENK